jgi:ABC-type polysaccharide transport system permease subunit
VTTPPQPPTSATRTDRFSKILFWVGLLIIPTILIIQVLVYQPFFGHMDDARHLEMIASASNLWAVMNNFANFWPSRQVGWLTNSPFLLAGVFGGPLLMYAASTIFVVLSVLLCALGLKESRLLPRSFLRA